MTLVTTRDEHLHHVWLAWLGGACLVAAETFNLVEAAYVTQNGFIVECQVWRDYAAILFGSGAIILFLFFFAMNAGTVAVNWKTWLRRVCFLDALRVTLYGFGFDVGIGTGCDHLL